MILALSATLIVIVALLATRRIGRKSYLPFGPFSAVGPVWDQWLRSLQSAPDALFYTLLQAGSGEPQGFGAYLRIFPADGEGKCAVQHTVSVSQ